MAQHDTAHGQNSEGALAREALAHSKAHVTDYHEPGTMDITSQQATFTTFVRFVTRMSIFIILLLVFLALVNG